MCRDIQKYAEIVRNLRGGAPALGDGPNTVSESTVSNTELSEFFFCPHRVPGRELSEFLSAYYLCEKANSPSFSQNSPSLPRNSVSSLPPKTPHFGTPRKKVYVRLISWGRTQKRDPHKLFRDDFWGVPNGQLFVPQKVSRLLFFSRPYFFRVSWCSGCVFQQALLQTPKTKMRYQKSGFSRTPKKVEVKGVGVEGRSGRRVHRASRGQSRSKSRSKGWELEGPESALEKPRKISSNEKVTQK